MNNVQTNGSVGMVVLLAMAAAGKYGLQLDANTLSILVGGVASLIGLAVHHGGHLDRIAAAAPVVAPPPAA